MSLVVSQLVKNYGSVPAVRGISFTVASSEFLSLLGPSGCGKTTTLRCIAGFEHPNGGSIHLDGKPVADAGTGFFMPPNKRHFGMVFQSYAVWPHMTVEENVAYPLRVQGGISSEDIRRRVADKLQAVNLAGYEKRLPSQLSGGQQQRVALARALVMEPRALLFDEPLSNLDAKLRERMRFELVEIQSALAIPAVYVTHDQSEAMVMSQTVIVMERGDIAQAGPPEQIYRRPRSRFVADFIGLSNFISGKVVGRAGADHWLVRSTLGDLVCSSDEPVAEGHDVVLAIRPESILLTTEASGSPNAFRVSMKSRYFLGPHTEYFVEAGECRLRVQTSDPLGAAVGSELFASVSPDRCHILPEEAAAVAAGESAVRAKQLQEE